MKKSFLLACVLSFSTILADSVERNGVSFQYQICSKYPSISHSEAYCITIKNNSTQNVTFDSSIISPPLLNDKNIQNTLSHRLKLLRLRNLGIALIPQVGIFAFRKTELVNRMPYLAIGGVTSILILKYLNDLAKSSLMAIREKVLNKEILKPGQSVEKLFWLKNPTDPVKINFDAIKVLK